MDSKTKKNDKLDTLDFIINLLIEHEERLSILIERLEKNADMIQDILKTEKLSQIRSKV